MSLQGPAALHLHNEAKTPNLRVGWDWKGHESDAKDTMMAGLAGVFAVAATKGLTRANRANIAGDGPPKPKGAVRRGHVRNEDRDVSPVSSTGADAGGDAREWQNRVGEPSLEFLQSRMHNGGDPTRYSATQPAFRTYD